VKSPKERIKPLKNKRSIYEKEESDDEQQEEQKVVEPVGKEEAEPKEIEVQIEKVKPAK